MSLLRSLAKFDSRLQRGLDNAFALVLGGRVVPAEIEELLKQQVQDNLVATEDDRIIAPNAYAVGVSSKDLENLSQHPELPERCADQLTRFVRNQGWEFMGPVVVRIAEESGLHIGQLRVSSDVVQDPESSSGFDAIEVALSHENRQPQQEPRSEEMIVTEKSDSSPQANPANPANPGYPPVAEPEAPTTVTSVPEREAQPSGPVVNLLLQDGSSRSYQVREGSNIIGRSNEADFRLPDTGVSRKHAEIMWDGSDAVLVDLQSTNGTTVNNTPIENWLLDDGDVITMGHSQIEVRINNPRKR